MDRTHLAWSQGGLTLERWSGVEGPHLGGLTSVLSSQAPALSSFQAGSAAMLCSLPYRLDAGARLRGTLTIPTEEVRKDRLLRRKEVDCAVF